MREKCHKKWKQECKQKQSLLFNFCNIFDLSTSRTPKYYGDTLFLSLIFICDFCSCIEFFFLSGFSFTDTDDSQDSRGREGTIFYSTLPLPPAHEDWDIYLQLCVWDDYHIFSIATLVFTIMLLICILVGKQLFLLLALIHVGLLFACCGCAK